MQKIINLYIAHCFLFDVERVYANILSNKYSLTYT